MKRAVASLALLALLLASGGACKGKQTEPGRPGRGARSGVAFAVDVMPVEAKKVDYVVTAPGTIEAFERVQVTARVAGVVDRVAFTEGQEVKKGAVLVVIDSERYFLAVNSAKAALDKADAAVRDNEAMVARREGASGKNPGLIPGEELESYRTKSVTARADREVALQALKTAQLNLRDSSVRAPIAGVIQTRTVETGQYVQPGYVMATLLRSEPLLLRFQVEPQAAPRLKPGMTAHFTMRETLRTFSASLTLISASADPETHMVPVTGQVIDEGHKYWLRPGSFCDVTVDIRAQRDAPLVPRLAARATDHGYVAYVIEGEVAKERVLTLGMSTKDGWVEVRSGLAAGDLLVVRGAEALSEGAKVRPTQVTAESFKKGEAGEPDAGAGPAPGAGPEPEASAAPEGAASAGSPPTRTEASAAPGGAASAGATPAPGGDTPGGGGRSRRRQGGPPPGGAPSGGAAP